MQRILQAACMLLFLVLFLYVCWPYGSRHYADAMRAREFIDAEVFLAMDPLVSISTGLAAKVFMWSLAWAGAVVLLGFVMPRAFCGFLCPLGTLIDVMEWAVLRRLKRFRIRKRGAWIHARFYILAAVLVAALPGVLLAGFVAPIPVLTRGLLFILGPLQVAALRGAYLVPPLTPAQMGAVLLLLAVLALSVLTPRFWCRHVCPSGALLSVFAPLAIMKRRVNASCTKCGKCLEACAFDAIRRDFSTRQLDCVSCQTCGAACPLGAIDFAGPSPIRRRAAGLAPADGPGLSRRTFVATLAGTGALATAFPRLAAGTWSGLGGAPVRAPGTVPEAAFLRLCIRCGACLKACPYHVLQAAGLEDGLDGLWAPRVYADWSGCDPTCNNCGQVCPTGAIRALPLEEKRAARMGLAVVDRAACLPHAGREECRLCIDECRSTGYDAIDVTHLAGEAGGGRDPVDAMGMLAPVVSAERCVGCGLCQTRCRAINVKEKKILQQSAIRVVAGPGHEDRMSRGSYVALRQSEGRAPSRRSDRDDSLPGEYLPGFFR